MIPFNRLISKITKIIYPVGSIYMSVNNTNPSNLFGGTWVAWGSGRVPVGVNTNDTDFNTVEKLGGNKNAKLTIDNIPSHDHTQRFNFQGNTTWPDSSLPNSGTPVVTKIGPTMNSSNWESITAGATTYKGKAGETIPYWITLKGANTSQTGKGTEFSIQQQYITCYMWKRTA